MKITILGLLLASFTQVAFGHANPSANKALLSSRSTSHKDNYALTARMHRQRRAARLSRRSTAKNSRVLKALLSSTAKMVAKRANKRQLSSGTTSTQPNNLAQGTATQEEGCTVWHTVAPGEVCLGVIDKSEGLTLEDFYGLNPDVGSQCQDLRVGLAYCIDTDHDDASVKNANLSTCKSKSTDSTSSSSSSNSSSDSSSSASASTSTADPVAIINIKPSQQAKPSSNSNTDQAGFFTSGMINFAEINTPSSCSSADPSEDQPNGSIDWLNCGINKSNPSSPWTPPKIAIHEVIVKELTSDGIFAPCAQYFSLFEKYGKLNDIPPIFLASFAMQESSCQAGARGDNGGAFGLMQITEDKCTSGIACDDPDYNVKTAAKYFRDTLDSVNGDLLLAIGQYNGWPAGMTYSQATAAANTGCCVCQNNLDYQNQMLNYWAQGRDASQAKVYNNLAVCGGSQSGNSKRSIAGHPFMRNWTPSS